MVWLSKREVAYYIVLKACFDSGAFNVGDALDLLKFLGSKRVGLKIVRRLASKGFLARGAGLLYHVNPLEEALTKLLRQYVTQRLYKNLRSLGFKVRLRGDTLVVDGECNETLRKLVEALKKLDIRVVCVAPVALEA